MESTIASENDVQYQEQTNTYYTRCRKDESPTTAIVRLVCTVLDREVTDLPPLQHTIETEALDVIFQRMPGRADGPTGKVQFEFADCDVTYRNDGVVVVEPRDGVAPVRSGPGPKKP